MDNSIWMRKRLRENSGRVNHYGGAQYFADDFTVIPSTHIRCGEKIAEIAEEDYGPPVNPHKPRNRPHVDQTPN